MPIIRLVILLALLFVPRAWATAYTASVTGNWNSAATWGGAGIPGSGDTAVINNGVTVTVPNGYTAVIGTSPANDSATPALACANTGSGTGILIVATGGTLVRKGTVIRCNSNWTFQAGSHLSYDSTGSVNPTTAMYTFQSSQNNSNPNDLLIFAGTSGSHVTVDSVSNNPTGGFGITPAIRWADGGNIQASYTDFSYCGASTTGACFETNPSTSAGKVALDHTTCDHCGQLVTDASIGAASTFTLAETSWTNPTNTSYTLQLNTSTARTTGTRLITFSVITGQISIISTGGQSTGITFTHNVVRKVFTSSAPMFTGTRDVSFDSFDDNLDFANTNSGSADQFSLPSGTATNFYLMSHCDPIAQCANEHPLYNQPGALNMDISNFVADYDSSDTFGDIFEPHNDATSAGVTLKVHNGVFLCGSTGLAIGSFINNSSATAQTNLKIYFEHITACGVLTASTQTFGVGCEAGTSWPAGAVPSIQ